MKSIIISAFLKFLQINNSHLFKEDKVDVSNLDNVRRKIGLVLTDEKEELPKTLPGHGEDLAQSLKLVFMGLCVKTSDIIYVYIQWNLFRKHNSYTKRNHLIVYILILKIGNIFHKSHTIKAEPYCHPRSTALSKSWPRKWGKPGKEEKERKETGK